MKTSFLSLLAATMILTVSCKDMPSTGLLLPDKKARELIPFDFPDTLEHFFPLAPVDLFEAFPPAASQGVQGSCAPFSIAYYIMSYYERTIGGYNYFDPAGRLDVGRVFSPSFIYNDLNSNSGDCSRGVSYVDTFSFIKEKGSCPWKNYPYFASRTQCSAPPTNDVRDLAKRFRNYVFKQFPISENNIKYYLQKKIPVIIGIYTSKGLKRIGYEHSDDKHFEWDPVRNDIEEYHSMLIVGFDDNYFRVLNSWGSDWGTAGTCYIPKKNLIGRAGEVYIAYNNRNVANNIFREGSPNSNLIKNMPDLRLEDSLMTSEFERIESQIAFNIEILSKIEERSEEQQLLFEQLKKYKHK